MFEYASKFFALLYLTCAVSLAQEQVAKKTLVINPIVDRSLPDFFKTKVSKAVLRASAKQGDFHLLIADLQASKTTQEANYNLNVQIIKKGQRYSIVADLVALKDQKRLIRIKKNNVGQDSLIRDTEVAVELLFRRYKEKKKRPASWEVISEGTLRQLKKNDLAFKRRSLTTKEKNLKSHIKETQRDIQQKLSRLANAQGRNKKENKKKKKVTEQKNYSAAKDNNQASQANLGLKALQEKYNYISFNIFSEDNASQSDLLGVQYKANYMGLEYEGGRSIFSSAWRMTYLFSYATVFSDVKVKLPDYQVFAVGLKRPIVKEKYFLGAWASYETLGFVNLPVATRGLQSSLNNLLWLDGELQVGFYWGKLAFLVRAGYGVVTLSQTDYLGLSEGLTGSRSKLGVIISGLSDKIDLMFRVHSRELSSGSLSVSSELIQGQLMYAF